MVVRSATFVYVDPLTFQNAVNVWIESLAHTAQEPQRFRAHGYQQTALDATHILVTVFGDN